MSADLKLTTAEYQMLLTIFYVVYAVFQWEFILLKYIPPKIWLTSVVTLWGLASALQGVTQNFGGMMACVGTFMPHAWYFADTQRIAIAALQAGGAPVISFYFTMLYPRKDFGLRWAIFQACSCISNAFAG